MKPWSPYWDRRRQMGNNDLLTELDYFSKDYDEEREMKPRPGPVRAITQPLRAASPSVRRRKERVVGFEETQNRGESRVERNNKGGRPSKEAPRGNGSKNINLLLLLAAHIERSKNGQPLQSSLTFVYRGQALPNNVGGKIPPNGKKEKSTAPVEAPILMINREDCAAKNTVSKSMAYKKDYISTSNTIEQRTCYHRSFGIQKKRRTSIHGQRRHMRGYLRTLFQETEPYHQSHESKHKPPPPLIGFSGKRSWSVREVPLEIIIGEHPLSRIEILNFVIRKSDSPHNMLLGRTAMQKIGIVVSTSHRAIKFHTKKGVETILSVGEAREETKKARRTLTISKERIPSCDDTKEKIVVSDKYPEQMGVKANPLNIKAVIELEQPLALKDIQSLDRKLAAFSRFLSKGAERSLPFFKVLKSCKGKKKIHWTDEANKAFKEIKNKKTSKILLSSHDNGSHRDERQTPADFLFEIPFDNSEKRVKEKEVSDPSNEWKLYTDGASSSDGAGAGLMLIDLVRKEYTYALRFEFETTNNEVEYEALLAGLHIA
nr:reverse transcriptase domain-containing protein [Tanacetum cinerariifolium]